MRDKAYRQILDGGIETVDATHGGEKRRNPAIITWRQASDMVTTLMNMLGMSPVSRARIQGRDSENADPFMDFLRRRNAGAVRTRTPAERYIDNVISGRVVVCRWVRLFCERHKGDLKTGRKRGLYFDRDAAQHAPSSSAICTTARAGGPERWSGWNPGKRH